jgi:hypothetical protein
MWIIAKSLTVAFVCDSDTMRWTGIPKSRKSQVINQEGDQNNYSKYVDGVALVYLI